MKLLNLKSMVIGIVGVILLLSSPASAEKIVDLVQNGNFEQVGEMNPEKPWFVYHTGKLGLTWAERMPGTKVKGQIIVSWYPKAVLDDRRYKAYTITMAIGTRGGGYEYWNGELFEPGSAGMRYFVGEATRMIADFDEFYLRDGNYTRDGFSSNLDTVDFYVIQRQDKRRALVFAYNDNAKPKAATIVCKHPGAQVRLWPSDEWMKGESYSVTIPPVDVLALEYRY